MGMWSRFSGVLGLVVLGFGLLSLLIFRGLYDIYTLAHLAIGVVLLVYWFFMSGARKAGEATQIISGRTVRYGLNAAIYTVLFVAILAAVNWIGSRHNKRIDLTEEGVYSLADQSAQLVKGLQKPLRIAAFDVAQEGQAGNLKELLGLYKDSNPGKVTTEFINPRTKPQLVEKYGMKGGNIIYLEYGDTEPTAISRLNETTEEAITNGIMKLTQGDAKKVYYLTGHGEAKLDDGATPDGLKSFADAAKDEHLTLEELTLSSKGSVPSDASAVILMSPKSPLLPGERDMLIKYVEEGGRLMMTVDPQHGEDVPAIAAHFGIEVQNDVVIDLVQRLLMGPTLATQFLAGNYAQHPITHGLSRQDAMVFDMADSLKTGTAGEGVTYTDLVKTSDQGWGEKNIKAIFDANEPTAQLDPDDNKGPVSVAVAYEKKTAAGESSGQSVPARTSRLVVFGDSDWMTNQFLRYASHRDVVLNSVNWLAGQESNISIRPRAMRTSLKPLQTDTFRSLLLTGFIVPEFILMLGLFIWWRRRTIAV